MAEFTLIIDLHPSIPSECRQLEGLISGDQSLLEGVISLLNTKSTISNLLVCDNDIRPGYLLLSDKTELRTTKKIFDKVVSNIQIRIIPISHGG